MTMSAPSLWTKSALVALAVVATVPPRCFASWIAIEPTPPAPAWTRTFCPRCRFPFSTSACQAVSAANGSEPASTRVHGANRIEQQTSKLGVGGSNPSERAKYLGAWRG